VAAVAFLDSDSALVPKFLNPELHQGPIFFKFENPTSVQTPAAINVTEFQPCSHLRKDIYENHEDFCYCPK